MGTRGADCIAARSAAARKSWWSFGRFQEPGRKKIGKKKGKERKRRKKQMKREKTGRPRAICGQRYPLPCFE